MSTRKKPYILRILLSLVLAGSAVLVQPVRAVHADTLIDTTPFWPGNSWVGNFGIPTTATFGQVITAPVGGEILQSFTFYMGQPATLAFQGEVYAWDGTMATGPNLFESVPMTTTGTGTEAVTFDAGGVPLQAGQQYVLFASCSRLFDGHSGLGAWGFIDSDVYGGGSFVYLDNGSDPSLWTTSRGRSCHTVTSRFRHISPRPST